MNSYYTNEDLEKKIISYVNKGILNTIFYGPSGSGKNSLVKRMLNSIGKPSLIELDKCEKEKKGYWNNDEIPFYTSSNYIKFNGSECVGKVTKLVRIIEEIAETKNISKNIKIIYIKNLNLLHSKQENLRQVVEDTFETCRFIFTVRNVDKVDSALNSRCMSLRIPCPNYTFFKSFIKKEIPTIQISDIDLLIESSARNINTLKILLTYYKKFGSVCNANKEIADSIKSDLQKFDTISDIHAIAEKYFTSEINILDICKYIDLDDGVLETIIDYANSDEASFYKLILIFYKLKFNLQK